MFPCRAAAAARRLPALYGVFDSFGSEGAIYRSELSPAPFMVLLLGFRGEFFTAQSLKKEVTAVLTYNLLHRGYNTKLP